MNKLPLSFYRRSDVVEIAQELLGKRLMTCIGGVRTGGRIVETEAYAGARDRACHAYGYRRTPRTETMFPAGGHAYVYLCYGIHWMFNVVTNVENEPDAVLVRAIEPEIGVESMLERRNRAKVDRSLCGGPGALGAALGLGKEHDATSLRSKVVWIEDGEGVRAEEILQGPRVGVGYAGEDAALPWRFRERKSPWTSPAK